MHFKDLLFSTSINLESFTVKQTPTESNASKALFHINKKHSYKIQKDLKLYKRHKILSTFIKVIMTKRNILLLDAFTDTLIVILMILTEFIQGLPPLQKLYKESWKNVFLISDFNSNLQLSSCKSVCNFSDELIKLFHTPNFSPFTKDLEVN